MLGGGVRHIFHRARQPIQEPGLSGLLRLHGLLLHVRLVLHGVWLLYRLGLRHLIHCAVYQRSTQPQSSTFLNAS